MSESVLEKQKASAYLSGENASYLEELYEKYLQDPNTIDPKWQYYFRGLTNGNVDVSHEAIREQLRQEARHPVRSSIAAVAPVSGSKQANVDALIEAHRRFGHCASKINPIFTEERIDARLSPAHHGLSDADNTTLFLTRGLLDKSEDTLSAIIARCQEIYLQHVGIEIAYIDNDEERNWLQSRIEQGEFNRSYAPEKQKQILQQLMAADGLEKYLGVKYVGQKRFSIEGGDTLIPMIHQLNEQASAAGVQEIVLGMAHRGRINVLLNVMGQPAQELFDEFDGTKAQGMTSGDVKYHLGYSNDIKTASGSLHLSLAFNPSHLEFINPVVMGSVRARQDKVSEGDPHDYAVPLLIHGDSAFSGQGVVMESLNMSQTRAYCVGGTMHIILNNQVGFTTSIPKDLRSSRYCSDLGKLIDAPILHVNGDDPEAACRVMELALAYRMKFHKDVIIDLVCYRLHGHNEADEPMATQPEMYQMIKKHQAPVKLYAQVLMDRGVVSQAEVDTEHLAYRDKLDQGQRMVELTSVGITRERAETWAPFIDAEWRSPGDTTFDREKLMAIGAELLKFPADFKLQRNVDMAMTARKKMNAGELPLDWGYAETMAYATLISEGYDVRMSGEDVRRGTFFHRLSALFDQETGQCFMPLVEFAKQKARVQIYDSLLSESGTVGFEYGYSVTNVNNLTIWEAQFGDFANGAQVIIDQFISSGWQKWNRLSGLVMLLPHGYEAMGPEHSSARLERYMQLAAQNNIQVCVPTTPAQIFHLLRRQVLRPYRRPLIVMSPKKLLRHKMATSTLDECANGAFQALIPEVDSHQPEKITRLILTSGKVYYELLTKKRELKRDGVAIVRIEQLYPFPYEELTAVATQYSNLETVVWCQEEPKNQGAWFCTRHRLVKSLPKGLSLFYVGRPSFAAPAAGYAALSNKQQEELVNNAFKETLSEKEQVRF